MQVLLLRSGERRSAINALAKAQRNTPIVCLNGGVISSDAVLPCHSHATSFADAQTEVLCHQLDRAVCTQILLIPYSSR